MPSPPNHLTDLFARTISYLRVSVTDRCNLRCTYCTPACPPERQRARRGASDELLSYEELLRVLKVAVELGIRKLRITGGEPLMRRGLVPFIGNLAELSPDLDIRLTTNGMLLGQYAEKLRAAGVGRLNVSLDSLRPDRFREITGGGDFGRVWRGIEQAFALGFAPIKLNMVVMRGVNDDELLDFARLSLEKPFQVRFIEFMPIGAGSTWDRSRFMAAAEMRERLEPFLGKLQEQRRTDGTAGPARIYRLAGAPGSVGFISPLSHHFCDSCNRLRLTAAGRLRACLFSDEEADLRNLLRSGGSDLDVRRLLLDAIARKPKGHEVRLDGSGQPATAGCRAGMSVIGG